MADCAPLLDEELSSFVFNYLTENSCSQELPHGNQYGEEEVCSDRLDTDFPDIDLSQLDPSDFDSVNCLSELQWCSDQEPNASPASIHYSTADELFQIEEENAALLAALTDSLDGMVDAEVGGLSVFPALEEEPDSDRDSLPLSQNFSQALGPDSEDPSLLKTLLLAPPNVPSGIDTSKDGVHSHRYSNRSQRLVKPLVKTDLPLDRKPRAVRPSGRLCTELHRHLTTSGHRGNEGTPTADSEDEEEEEEEEEEDSESEEEDEDSSGSDAEAARPHSEPPKPQFSSEKELQSVVDLITYMHTYCLPSRKQQGGGWDRRDRDAHKARPRPASSGANQSNSHTRVVLVATPGSSERANGTSSSSASSGAHPRRIPFTRRREFKANSLLRDLLQQTSSYDVSKPYRLHSPPYAHASSPNRGAKVAPFVTPSSATTTTTTGSKADRSSPDRSSSSVDISLDTAVLEDGGSFSVRRSRRLASFPSRFAKRHRPARPAVVEKREEREEGKLAPKLTQAPETPIEAELLTPTDAEQTKPCCHNEKRACLCLPLNPKSTGEPPFSTKPFEPTLSVDLCGTAGLTPPTTPPHKPVEDELFKPTDANKTTATGTGSDGGGGGGGGGDSINPASNSNNSSSSSSSSSGGANPGPKPSSWLRGAPNRKLPEQTELYAQLRRMGQAGDDTQRSFGDHDYCALSLGESRKRSAAILGAMLQAQTGKEEAMSTNDCADEEVPVETKPLEEDSAVDSEPGLEAVTGDEGADASPSPPECQSSTPPASEEETERSSPSRSPSPALHLCPDSPASKTDSSENSEICADETERKEAASDEDNCQVFYIHNLPSSVTQNMLRKRFQVFGKAEDCKVIICNEERCGVIKIRQNGGQRHRRETVFNNAPAGQRRLTRKRYIDLDEAGPGPVKSKYDALDFDTLLKEAQKSLHR